MSLKPLNENVSRVDVEHVQAFGIENGKDVSAYKRTWRSYFWDTWDKSPEACTSRLFHQYFSTDFDCFRNGVSFLR